MKRLGIILCCWCPIALAQTQSDLDAITRLLQEEVARQQSGAAQRPAQQQPPPAQAAVQQPVRAAPPPPTIQQSTTVGGQSAGTVVDDIMIGENEPPSLKIHENDRTDVTPTSRDTRLVKFRFRKDAAYEIRSRVGMITHIVLPESERVVQIAFSDTSNWEFTVSDDRRRVFIRPLVANAVNTAVIITDTKEYELVLTSHGPGKTWYQRVTWEEGFSGTIWRALNKPQSIDPQRLNFNYEIRDKSRTFVIRQVYDDGERTYFVVDPRRQFPMIVRKGGRRSDEIVPYIVDDDRIVVNGVGSAWEARLGRERVRIVGR